MKKFSILALALSILAVSCNKESGILEPGKGEAGAFTVTASVSNVTKAVTVGDVTTFQNEDQLSLYAWTGSNEAVPDKLWINGEVNTYNETSKKWTPENQMLWKNVHDEHYFIGIYPARTVKKFSEDPFELDPSTEAYESNDLLVATELTGLKAETDLQTNTVDLVFDHLMAKLNLNIRFRNQWGGIPENVSVSVKAAMTGTIDYLTKNINVGDNTAYQIFNLVGNAAEAPVSYYTSLVIPQVIKEVNITVYNKTYTYKNEDGITLTAGMVTTLPLVVGKDLIELDGDVVTVSDWTEGTLSENLNGNSSAVYGIARPLTVKAMEDETIVTFKNRAQGPVTFVTNAGKSGVIGSDTSYDIVLAKGQRVWFLGDNACYGNEDYNLASNINFSKTCEVYGNVMSLIDSKNFATATTLTEPFTFANLFLMNWNLVNNAKESIYLPATTLTEGCYMQMFALCTGLTEVTILANDITASNCVSGWLDSGVGANFSLIAANPYLWSVGTNLPEGCTVYTPAETPDASPVKIYTTPTHKTGLMYNTEAQELLDAGIIYVDGLTMEYSLDGENWSTEIPAGINAGYHTVYSRLQNAPEVVSSYQVYMFKANPTYTAPTFKSGLVYNGSAQALINAGTTNGGTMQYRLSSGSWSTELPTGTNAGSYTVYWQIEGDDNYNSVSIESLGSVSVDKANGYVTLSSYSSSGWGEMFSSKSVNVTVSHHGGSLSVNSTSYSDFLVIDTSISGNTVTISKRNQYNHGTGQVTITSAATTNYKAASATYYLNE